MARHLFLAKVLQDTFFDVGTCLEDVDELFVISGVLDAESCAHEGDMENWKEHFSS